MAKIYLDYGASTPVDRRVAAAMAPYFTVKYGNASSSHSAGQEASAAIFKARSTIAAAIGAKYDEVVFTGSATEANNLALRGVVKAAIRQGVQRPHLILSSFEHPSVLLTGRDLEADGVEVTYLPVSHDGLVDLRVLKRALKKTTVLVSVMYVNNEVGMIQPISKISEIIRNFRKSIIMNSVFPLLHTDAVQAFQYLDCDVEELGVDLMTLSAHKIYGPKGIGALYVRKYINHPTFRIRPLITGGGQEPRELNSGTPNTPSIVGFGRAVEVNEELKIKEAQRITALRNDAWQTIKRYWPSVRLNGTLANRVANNLNIYFPGRNAQELMIGLDLAGIAVSSGVACSARAIVPSAAITAMGLGVRRASGSLRITLGRPTRKQHINYLAKQLALLK